MVRGFCFIGLIEEKDGKKVVGLVIIAVSSREPKHSKFRLAMCLSSAKTVSGPVACELWCCPKVLHLTVS